MTTSIPRMALRSPTFLFSILVLALVGLWALMPAAFSQTDPLATGSGTFLPPSAEHWFGTDNLGRDVFGRVVHGAALSLSAAVAAVAIAFVLGSILGLLAGYLGGWADAVISRTVDVLLAIPSLLLSMAIITALGFGSAVIALAVGISSIAVFARVMRAEAMRVRVTDYVEAAATMGGRWHRILWRHMLPNAAGPVVALIALEFGTAVLAISSLTFLGYGTEWPAPEWGALISDGRNYLPGRWWVSTLPGVVIVAVVLAANRIGRFARSAGGHQ